MRRTARFLTILAAAAFVLAPALADARPGGRSSSGSRGARTYSAPPSTTTAPAAPRQFDRTMQQPTAPRPGTPGAGAASPARQGGFFARNPFMGGLMAGMLGAGIFGLLAGGGFFGGLGSMAGFLGFLLQIAIIAGLVALVVSFLRRRQQPAPAGLPNAMMREGAPPQPAMTGGSAGRGPAGDAITIDAADFAAFEKSLFEVNSAWSREDLDGLTRLATPEMVQYFRDDFNALKERGWKNETRDVKLEQGDLSEAWSEGPRDYATVAMRFSLVDVTRDLKTGEVTEGDPNVRSMATELWTFVRVQGGPWTLSAIQQAS
ncbi:TIM44-like domain-containing protein [Roseococcus pinisoli]|uniref:TIM44-like domain-containing protein n=1 Tax=Roseococcus pinisoli TaxID=2835040 RepID=A0ABS5Q981_9PROT|nr:TIM44-like domain-containing protein [Roseococcus pinisoli]MBS7810254.1 TIM44-like domain-containing protein [Roseococcus pinisoli]